MLLLPLATTEGGTIISAVLCMSPYRSDHLITGLAFPLPAYGL